MDCEAPRSGSSRAGHPHPSRAYACRRARNVVGMSGFRSVHAATEGHRCAVFRAICRPAPTDPRLDLVREKFRFPAEGHCPFKGFLSCRVVPPSIAGGSCSGRILRYRSAEQLARSTEFALVSAVIDSRRPCGTAMSDGEASQWLRQVSLGEEDSPVVILVSALRPDRKNYPGTHCGPISRAGPAGFGRGLLSGRMAMALALRHGSVDFIWNSGATGENLLMCPNRHGLHSDPRVRERPSDHGILQGVNPHPCLQLQRMIPVGREQTRASVDFVD